MILDEEIVSSVYRVFDKAKGLWQRKSFWNKAKDTEFEDGKTAEEKLGNIDGITDSTTTTSSKLAASATAVKGIAQRLNMATTRASVRSSSDTTKERTALTGNLDSNNPNIEVTHYAADSTTAEDSLRVYFDGANFYARGVKDGADAVVKKLGSIEPNVIQAVSMPYTAPSNGIIIVQCLSGRLAVSADDGQTHAYANTAKAATNISVDGTVVKSASGGNSTSQFVTLSTHPYGYYQCESSYVGALKKGQVVRISMKSSNDTGSYYYAYSDYNAWFIPE